MPNATQSKKKLPVSTSDELTKHGNTGNFLNKRKAAHINQQAAETG
jgi:hypothetical protein